MNSFKTSVFAAVAATLLGFAGCKKDTTDAPPALGTVDIEFENTVGEDAVALDGTRYTTLAGDHFDITTLKYYVSNLKLNRADGSSYAVPESYYLVNQEVESTHKIALKNIPVGDYTSLSFVVGVDSARNTAGAQQGALDPNNNMFWTWNSGYIFLKLEGNSPEAAPAGSTTPGGLVFHIGGFRKPTNTIRTVTLPMMPAGTKLLVRTDHSPEVHVNADVQKLFSGPMTLRFATVPTTATTMTLTNTMGGPNSVIVANNYANPAGGMFSVEHVHAN